MVRRGRIIGMAVAVGLVGSAVALGASADAAAPGVVTGSLGTVAAAGMPAGWAGWTVEARASGSSADPSSAVVAADGTFSVPAPAAPEDGVVWLRAVAPADPVHPDAVPATLAAVLPVGAGSAVINERTTVAMAWAMAQFVSATGVAGVAPGIRNAAGMAANLADTATGAEAEVLASPPNGAETSTEAAFHTLTAALATCVTSPFADPVRYPDGTCREIVSLGALATAPETPVDPLRALSGVARNPSSAPERLYELSTLTALDPASAVLDRSPVAWTLALRFDGDGQSLAGPGNFAVDHEGDIWVINNYQYDADPHSPVCGSDEVFRFSPTGEMTAFTGGGLSGAGFGVGIDVPTGNVWVANFGFAAPAPGCPADQQPPHDSASLFTSEGVALSPADTGFTQGSLNWPQGLAIDANRSVWFANCNDGTVTVYPGGDPAQARIVPADELDLDQPFDVVDNGSALFVSGIVNDAVDMLSYDGGVLAGSPGPNAAFDNPMGLASSADGTVWVANSGGVTLPCPVRPDSGGPTFDSLMAAQFDDRGVWDGAGQDPYLGSVAAIAADGSTVEQYEGGGATLPWGIATDGDGNVWVANFAGKRLSAFCGTTASTCPEGLTTGDAISPDITGYFFDGLVRNTGVAIDQSGTVWLANNWAEVPLQTNPAGHEIVAFLGLAAPIAVAAPDAPPTPPVSPTPSSSAAASAELAATGAPVTPALALAALALLVAALATALLAARRRER
ncbi:hypothetical protein GCM10010988_11840 [Cnuibacter physcomitrellae]|nr:hypothetical protein GCM10010988_11840 [Cnuibacter physcomitrellae]